MTTSENPPRRITFLSSSKASHLMKSPLVFLLLCFVLGAFADLYIHNPRGSNNRLNENNVNRDNANRLFDSQNNAKGGYCYGPAMSYYEASQLTVEWTNQHGCGVNEKLVCNLVIQYMCGPSDAPDELLIRDGASTDRIPNNNNGPTQRNGAGELTFGMHEPREFYTACNTRNRNEGLWIADRNLNGNTAIYTRQNNNGGRQGYECPEERDYYPYWAPSPWKDIAILTNDESLCGFYRSESQNVKSRFYCADENGAQAPPNSQTECQQQSNQGNNGPLTWREVPAFGLPAPECAIAPWSRDNHLGNAADIPGFASLFNWTLPTAEQEPCIASDNCNCVLRMRYNISTADLGPNGNHPQANFIDWASNAGASPVTNDPIVEHQGVAVQLAVDTSQFGRTFEDRSFVFHVRPRPDGVSPSARIYNLNVRGKRGNIVQTYPSVEYDFVPENIEARLGDYIHFQWTGCDTNPAGNAGEGTDKTDRSNIVQIAEPGASYPATESWIASNTPLFDSPDVRKRMALVDQTNCLSQEELLAKNNNNADQAKQDVQNCMKLNAAPQHFDGGLMKMNSTGTFYYMSTRNNNFSNRGQKGVINVTSGGLPTWGIIVIAVGGVVFLAALAGAGVLVYAKTHPHSRLGGIFNR